jgi:nucleotide-binding universal stress UspA family protein
MPGYVAAMDDIERESRRAFEEEIAALPGDVRAEGVFVVGDAARELSDQSQGVDLLLLGSRGYGPLRAVLLGGVSHVVVRNAACPVIVLPRGARAGLGELFSSAAEASASVPAS